MKVVCIIQARLGSKRLPGKVLMDIAGRPLIAHVVERALAIQGVDEVILNVPEDDLDAFHAAFTSGPIPDMDMVVTCQKYLMVGVPKQEQDVLGSYQEIAEDRQADVVMRLTGDCPLLDWHLCDRVLDLYHKLGNALAFCANDTTRSGYPDGTDCEVFSIQALKMAANKAIDPFEREHVTVWLRQHLFAYGILSPYGTDLSKRKWSVDEQQDLDQVRAIHRYLAPGEFGWQQTVAAEDAHMQEVFG